MPNGHEKTAYRDGGRGRAVVASDLDPKFTFDSFVVGPANRLAAAAARRVSDAPGTSYNPLFIYSSSGLGKSHILNSIAHYAARVHPGFGVMYVTVESFLNELTQAIQAGEEKEFRERYQELHILLLDDVQFFTGQKEAQEILLRLLDGMSKSGGQVVLASDRPPAEINELDARLLTRFSGGLIVDIAVPEYETKVAILRKKAEERGQTFEGGVAEALAKHAFTSIRALAGALNKVLAIQELEGRQVEANEIGALAGLQEEAPSEGPIAGQQLLDEFGSFMEGLSQTVTSAEPQEEPWRRLLRETAELFERDGYSGTRLRRLLESDKSPPEPQEVADQFRRDIAQLRQVEKSLASAGNPWPEAAVGVLKDPERLDEAASLLASALERVKPFLRVGQGPWLDDLTSSYDAVVIKAAGQLVTEERPEYNPLYSMEYEPCRSVGASCGDGAIVPGKASAFKHRHRFRCGIRGGLHSSVVGGCGRGVAGTLVGCGPPAPLRRGADFSDRARQGRALPSPRGLESQRHQDSYCGGPAPLGGRRHRREVTDPLRDGPRGGGTR